MRLGKGHSGITMSFVDVFACALGAIIFILLTTNIQDSEFDPIVPQPLDIVTENVPALHIGVPTLFAFSARGGTGSYLWRMIAEPEDRTKCGRATGITGLPEGVSLTEDGRLVGVPKAAPAKKDRPLELPQRYCFDVEVRNATGEPSQNATPWIDLTPSRRSLALELWPPLAIQPSKAQAVRLPPAHVMERYVYRFNETEKVADRRWSVKASFKSDRTENPTDIVDVKIDDKTGTLTWLPQFRGQLSLSVSVTERDEVTTSYFLIEVKDRPVVYHPPSIVTTQMPNVVAGLSYHVALSAVGGEPPLSWRVEGILPKGIRLDSETGIIEGKVAQEELLGRRMREYSVKTSIKDYRGVESASPPMLLQLVSAGRPDQDQIKIITTQEEVSKSPFIIGRSDQKFLFAAVGGRGRKIWDIKFESEHLGLSVENDAIMAPSDPMQLQPGVVQVLVSVKNDDGEDHARFNIHTVPSAPRIVSTTFGPLRAGRDVRLALSATGGTPPYRIEAAMPESAKWLRSEQNGSVLTLLGTPRTPGVFAVTARAVDSREVSGASVQIPVVISPAMAIQASDLYVHHAEAPFRERLYASGGTGAKQWYLLPSSQSSWLSITEDGELTGMTDALGDHAVEVAVKDQTNETAQRTIKVKVIPQKSAQAIAHYLRQRKTWKEIEAYFKGYAQCSESGNLCVLPDGVVNEDYHAGLMPGLAELVEGNIPDGLHNPPPEDGWLFWTLGGTPRRAGTFAFSLSIRDGDRNAVINRVTLQLTVLTPWEKVRSALWLWLSSFWS